MREDQLKLLALINITFILSGIGLVSVLFKILLKDKIDYLKVMYCFLFLIIMVLSFMIIKR